MRNGTGKWLDGQCVSGKKTTLSLVAGVQGRAVEGVGKDAAVAGIGRCVIA